MVYPNGKDPLNVYCDMDTDGGGWLVIQRRRDGKENFYRSYHDYEVGFGNVTDELYIGNKNIHDITSRCTYKLKVILTDFQNNTKTVDYKSFSVGDSQSKYTLHVSGYSGDAGDSLAFDHDGHAFSAPDADNDGAKSVNCAQKHHGGYWYSNCFKSNINGAWGKAGETGIIWGSYKSWQLYVLKETTMMVKPVNCS
ncbi:hypothetical protein FSP39_023646 [Pinctada imbricata]|uniref:Fibrinogen C-terminal domain-containing protein n=1 Tax=Pinctada imbricata TaxID=66713 RepID=A0AA88Y8P5_PINIB|nr:hypothetical protein FSP39_023646 [Pinctada imbricata]